MNKARSLFPSLIHVWLTLYLKKTYSWNLRAKKLSKVFSWEPALGLANSRDDDDDDVQKKALQFSAINSDF